MVEDVPPSPSSPHVPSAALRRDLTHGAHFPRSNADIAPIRKAGRTPARAFGGQHSRGISNECYCQLSNLVILPSSFFAMSTGREQAQTNVVSFCHEFCSTVIPEQTQDEAVFLVLDLRPQDAHQRGSVWELRDLCRREELHLPLPAGICSVDLARLVCPVTSGQAGRLHPSDWAAGRFGP